MSDVGKPYVWLTGAGGQLGTALLRLYPDPDDFCWYPTVHRDLDLTNLQAVRSLLAARSPVVVVNCAAYTNVERAEEDRDRSYAVNADVPGWLTTLHDHVIHIGTDYVFDGLQNTAYIEGGGKENPISVYGLSKLKGERLALAHGATVLRVSWLYGPTKWGNGGFYGKIRKQINDGARLCVVTDEVSCPTSTLTVARVIYRLIERYVVDGHWTQGVFHVTDLGEASRYDFAKEIARELGYEREVLPTFRANFVTRAQRPAYSVLAKGCLSDEYPELFRPWREALSEVIEVDSE